MTANVTVTMTQGDDKTLTVTVQDSNGSPISLNAAQSIKYKVARRVTSTTFVIEKSLGSGIALVTDGSDGKLRVTLDGVDTESLKGDYFYEIEIKDSTGKFATPLQGTMTINAAMIRNA